MADRTGNRAYELIGTEFDFKADIDSAKSMEAYSLALAISRCVTDLLARTEHGSKDEEIVMDALFNAAPQCAGARPTVVSRTFLRAFVMDSLYRASISAVAKPIFDLG